MSHRADIIALAASCGWSVEETGGGCDALGHAGPDDHFWWITDVEGATVPEQYGECILGRYRTNGDQIGQWRIDLKAALAAVRSMEQIGLTSEAQISDVLRANGGGPNLMLPPKLVIEWVRVPDHEVPTNLVKLGESVDAEGARVLSWHVVPRLGGAHAIYMRLDGIEEGRRFAEWSVSRWVQEGGRS